MKFFFWAQPINVVIPIIMLIRQDLAIITHLTTTFDYLPETDEISRGLCEQDFHALLVRVWLKVTPYKFFLKKLVA